MCTYWNQQPLFVWLGEWVPLGKRGVKATQHVIRCLRPPYLYLTVNKAFRGYRVLDIFIHPASQPRLCNVYDAWVFREVSNDKSLF